MSTAAGNGTPGKVRWGIVSTAQIGRNVFIPALRAAPRGELAAVAGRDAGRTEAFARELGIPAVFSGYDALLTSDAVDAVYLPLPNTMHEEWALRAAACGKHVFCEKPLAGSAAAGQRMVDAARRRGVLLWEAMVFRYHPQTLRLRRLLDGGAIGDLRHLQMRMSFNLPAGGNIRWQPELGGGVLQDVGCYLITVARWAAGSEPIQVSAAWQLDAERGVDRRLTLLLVFPGGVTAALYGGFDGLTTPGAHLIGSGGSLQIEQPTHPYEESAYTLTTPAATERVELHNGVRAFTPALDHFHDCVLDGRAPLLDAGDAIGTLRVMDAAAEAARTNRTVTIA